MAQSVALLQSVHGTAIRFAQLIKVHYLSINNGNLFMFTSHLYFDLYSTAIAIDIIKIQHQYHKMSALAFF